jgi:hypothetical protein
MHKNAPLIILILVLLLGMNILSISHANDFDEGIKAYDNGNFKKAYSLFLKEAKKGNATAQNEIGVMYAKGKGVLKDYKEAMKWYRLAAEQGLAMAQYNIGVMYRNGQGVLKDYKEAMKWYRLAAEQGYSGAKCNLAEAYATGKGVSKSYSEAKRWAKEGFEAGEEYCNEVWKKYNLANY